MSQVHDKLSSLSSPIEPIALPDLHVVPPVPVQVKAKRGEVVKSIFILSIAAGLVTYAIFKNHATVPASPLSSAVSADPQNTTAMLRAAFTQRTSDPEKAEKLLLQVIALTPGDAIAYNNLGRIKSVAGHWNEAIPLYKKSLALSPDYADAAMNLATAFETSNQWASAIAEYEAFLNLDKIHVDLHPKIRRRLRLLRAFETYSQNQKDKS